MTNRTSQKNHRILAIAPSARGFGFAVMEGQTLVDWGVKSVKGDKNVRSLTKIEKLIVQYDPRVLVLHRAEAKEDRRSRRIRILTGQIVIEAAGRKLKVVLFSRKEIRRTFFEDGKGTKHTIASVLARRFSEELGFRLPPKRRPWSNEDSRMDIFDAVALALALRLRTRK